MQATGRHKASAIQWGRGGRRQHGVTMAKGRARSTCRTQATHSVHLAGAAGGLPAVGPTEGSKRRLISCLVHIWSSLPRNPCLCVRAGHAAPSAVGMVTGYGRALHAHTDACGCT